LELIGKLELGTRRVLARRQTGRRRYQLLLGDDLIDAKWYFAYESAWDDGRSAGSGSVRRAR